MRTRSGIVHRRRRQKIMKAASGFRGGRGRLYRVASSAVMKAGQHAYNSRRQRKRQMRALWIMRINAAARQHGFSYSKLIHALGQSQVILDRKALADLAMNDPIAFEALVRKIA